MARTGGFGTSASSLSQVAKPVFRPASSDARLVFGRRSHRRRKALTTPLRTARVLPRARGVNQRPVPQAGAELRNVAIFHGRAGINGRADNPREDHYSSCASVQAVSECPFHLLVVRWVDVRLHHNHVLVTILGSAVAPE